MNAEFSNYKKAILDYLEHFLKEKSEEFSAINTWGKDVCDRFLEFMSQGKMLRGSLVFASYALFENKKSEDIIRAASAIELLHSSLLIHDDIMDRDTMRRGKPTIWTQYSKWEIGSGNVEKEVGGGKLEKEVGRKRNDEATHFGNSMAICFGDMGFFLAYELLSKIDSQRIHVLFSRELSSVVLAQMQDVFHGFSSNEPTKEEIIKLYIYKTGRYTFSLPLMTGSILAKQEQSVISSLSRIGELLGILFQLKDDELGLFGEEKETGKPKGSDIRENKKTIYRLFLFQKLSKYPTHPVRGDTDIYDLYKKYNIQQEVKEYMNGIENKIEEEIKRLSIKESKKKLFYELLEFNLERKK